MNKEVDLMNEDGEVSDANQGMGTSMRGTVAHRPVMYPCNHIHAL
jgi:hypothetical protein